MKLKRGTQGRGHYFSLEEKEECKQSLIQPIKGQELLKGRVWEGGWSACSSLHTFGCPTPPALDRCSRNACFYRAQGCLHLAGVGSAREGVFLLGGGVLPLGSGSGPKGRARVPWYHLQLQSEEAPHRSCVWTSR